jgi:hypothetical protein
MEDGFFIAYLEKNGGIRFPLDDDGIKTRSAQRQGDLPSGVGFRIDSCLRRLGEYSIAARSIKGGVCQRAQGEDEAILRREGIDARWVFVKKNIRS